MASEHPERETPDFYHHWMDEEVRFHDLDAFGHVNNNVIGIYFESIRMAWLSELYPEGWRKDEHFVLAKVSTVFLREVLFPNKFRLGKRVLRLGRSSMVTVGGLFVNNTCHALSEAVSVWIDAKSKQSAPIPDSMRQILQRYT